MEEILKQIVTSLEEVKTGLGTLDQRMGSLDQRMDGLDQRMDILEHNQAIFIQENRELRLEYDTRDRIARERHEEILNRFDYIARDIDINWDMGISNKREIERIKKQLHESGH